MQLYIQSNFFFPLTYKILNKNLDFFSFFSPPLSRRTYGALGEGLLLLFLCVCLCLWVYVCGVGGARGGFGFKWEIFSFFCN